MLIWSQESLSILEFKIISLFVFFNLLVSSLVLNSVKSLQQTMFSYSKIWINFGNSKVSFLSFLKDSNSKVKIDM